MSKKAIHESVELEQQPTIVKFNSYPSTTYINEHHLQSTGNYEQFSYTGNKEQIDAKFQELKGDYIANVGYKVSLTRTRLNGYVWKLDVKIDELEVKDPDAEVSAEDEQSLSQKYGTKGNPRLKSVNISLTDQDILLHDKYKNVPPINLGVIRMYQDGALESDLIPDPADPSISHTCGEWMHWSDDLVQMALKYKTYKVPNIVLTFTYFSKQKPALDTEIPKFYNSGDSFCDGYKVPEGWQAMFGGRGSERTEEKKGFVVTETYSIGKYPIEIYEKEN